jgi:hypothetical protein
VFSVVASAADAELAQAKSAASPQAAKLAPKLDLPLDISDILLYV